MEIQRLTQSLRALIKDHYNIDDSSAVNVTLPTDPEFGDYTTNCAFALAKQLNKNPHELAQEIASALTTADTNHRYTSVTAKNGFINISLSNSVLVENINSILVKSSDYGHVEATNTRRFVVEYFQNNVAKPPHVGHLRSAVIGDCLLRIIRFRGYHAVSDTHIGDWGTQFGILIYAYKTMGDKSVIEKDPINELNNLYIALSKKIEEQPELREKGKEEFKKLETGDPENHQLWQWFIAVSLQDFARHHNALGLLPFDYNLGESFYVKHMPAVLEEFKQKGLISIGETGEQYVDLSKEKLGRCILVKSDGATTYHLRDFATYIYRKQQFNFTDNLYVVDNRQSHHFRQLFAVLEKAGYPALSNSVHVDFGFMSLPEGVMSTRAGTTISLEKLLEEASLRALSIITEKNPGLPDKAAVAKQIGLAAIKYFDLSHNRSTEIIFNWDAALSFEGNSGPYLQYTYARIQNILRKANINDDAPISFTAPTDFSEIELRIMRQLVHFEETLESVLTGYYPNLLCEYLFTLGQLCNTFYQQIPVLTETDEKRQQYYYGLLAAAAQIIKTGLSLLGIAAPPRM